MQIKAGLPFSKPGFLIRRLQQLSVRIFLEEAGHFEVSPVQYGALEVIRQRAGIDQITLSQATDVDRTTIVRILDRLQQMGLVRKESNQLDRRSNQLYVTEQGARLVDDARSATDASQRRLMNALSEQEQQTFLSLATKIVLAHTAQSRPGASAQLAMQ